MIPAAPSAWSAASRNCLLGARRPRSTEDTCSSLYPIAVPSSDWSNAALHGREGSRARGRDFRLALTVRAGATLRIEVTDARPDRRPPGPDSLRPAPPKDESGRGLLLVEALAARWGATCGDPYTKTVWCAFGLA
ncbi:ATP-binding protein [Streptomyces fagopyri]|uniref:ATP-binding protein n=1 Tax=Streptomyces fagopyri TaxID=2662397 RepID=UPI003805FEF3